LIEAGEQAALWRHHRDWCQRLVDGAAAQWFSDRPPYRCDRLAAATPT